MGRVRSTYGGEVHTEFWWGDMMQGGHLEDPGVDGSIILKLTFKKWDGDMDWIDLFQDMEVRRDLVKAELNLRVT
jgi:hypothetical protein